MSADRAAIHLSPKTAVKDDEAGASLDGEVLDRLQELFAGDEPAAMHRFISELLDDAAVVISKLKDAVSEMDSTMVHEQAHALKGIVGLVGAIRLSEICARLEARGSVSDLEGASNDVTQIELELTNVGTALRLRFPDPD